MELKVPSPKSGCLSSSDCVNDREEKEISDDDDDRNHKHRRRGTHSESLEGDTTEPFRSKPFRKWNRPFGAGEKEFSSKFDRKHTGFKVFPQTSSNVNQRMRGNQFFSGEQAISRGRGRVSGSWNQRDPRFNSVDVAAQLVQQGPIPPSLYTSSGLPNVSNAQSVSWNGFGFIPGIPNGGLDMLHSVNLQASLRPPINATLSIGIPRQRCRDFEERGFCLRGDMCPMEHGVNRIVIEDVQSLSQFNLPVSLPSGHQVAMSAGLGPSQPGNASTTSMNVKGIMGKVSKTGINDDDMVMDGAIPDTACTSGSDFYDPDQPLWNDHGLETSNALLSLRSPGLEPESFTKEAPSDQLHVQVREVTSSDGQIGSVRTSSATKHTSSSVWARINAPRNKFDKENVNSTRSTFQYHETEVEEGKDEISGVEAASCQGNGVNVDDTRLNHLEKPFKNQGDKKWNVRKSSQKAHRTLFVSGVPQKSNKKEALLCHFQKFGDVIGIHIPVNSERAFVQFSKREEAEAALQAPDAVMGNRFIKLWWANRDSIPDDGISNSTGVSVIRYGMLPASVPSHLISPGRGKDVAHQSSALEGVADMVTRSDHPKPVNASKVPPTVQKKLGNLEQLKEEIRRKQQMLDQKRDSFRRQLDKLEKQASGFKVEMVEHAAKRLKVGQVDGANSVSPRSSYSGSAVPSPHAEASTDKEKSVENIESHCPKTSTSIVSQQTLKESVSLLPMYKHESGKPCLTFRIVPPLPEGLANDAALKEHFSSYDDLSGIELEDFETDNDGVQLNGLFNCSARISFTTHLAAERAFIEGTCWRGHNLKFMWLASSSPDKIEGKVPSSPEGPSDLCFALTEKLACEATESTVCEGESGNSQLKSDSEQS